MGFLLLLLCCVPLHAQVGCMDYSLHANRCCNRHNCCGSAEGKKMCAAKEFDTKTLFYVSCSCPCYRWPWGPRGECPQCRHYHSPKTDLIISQTSAKTE